jgi:hypothetical protein
MTFLAAATTAAADPAGGAAIDQVVIATGSAMLILGGLALLVIRYRAGGARWFAELARFSERVSGLPSWAAIPTAVSGVSLVVALLGMYWDIALHIGDGRDAGPLANPAHYLILAGLFGVFAAGVLAIAMPRDTTPGPAAVTLAPGWSAPVGGLLMASCGAFALAGFPLDDMWHRLFGQDVTLWGPTHLMLIGGAGMSLIGQAVLLQEGLRARPQTPRSELRGIIARVAMARHVALMGGLLIGLSTFQAEFDFGVPQFRAVNQPVLIAIAAGVALVAARVWIGRGGALGAALFFLAVRGLVALLVGPVFGETTPSMPLYLGEALAVEAAALAIGRRRPLLLGAVGGLLVGTVGFATEWAWTRVAMKLPWETAMLPEALVAAAIAGTAAGVLGGLTGAALRGELPRPAVARGTAVAAAVTVALVVADGLYETAPPQVRAALTVEETGGGEGNVAARLEPADAAGDAAWLSVTSWQGGGLVVDRLERGSDGAWRTTRPVPIDGDWKTVVRLHEGRAVIGAPIWLPADPAIPVEAVPVRASVEREFVPDRKLLQRELKGDIPGWLWAGASAVVLALALGFLGTLAWGLGRVARHAERPEATQPPAPRSGPRFTRAPSGAATA